MVMGKKKKQPVKSSTDRRANIDITDIAWPVWGIYSTRYTSKGVASAGAVLFAKLSDTEKDDLIDIVMGIKKTPDDLAAFLDETASQYDLEEIERRRKRRSPLKSK